MSLSLALNNALSGLNVTQRALGVLSNNVANANTVGYSRQVVDLSPRVVATTGSGVQIDGIARKVDEYLIRAVQNQTTVNSGKQLITDYMGRIQILTGEPGKSNSIDEYIDTFFSSIKSLSQTPEVSSLRTQAANAGRILAQQLSSLAGNLEDLRYQADQDIQYGIQTVNEDLRRLYEINMTLFRASANGDPTASILDQRDKLITEISEYLDVSVVVHEYGNVALYTKGGTPLIEELPYQLQYTGVNSVDALINDVPLSGITVSRLNQDGTLDKNTSFVLATAGKSSEITTPLVNGKLKSLMDMRDKEIPDILNSLDEMASTMRDEMNAIHNSGSGYPPASKLIGTREVNPFATLDWTGVARIAALNPDGSAIDSRYRTDTSDMLALDLNFDELQSQYGGGFTVQDMIKEINQHFQPQNKVHVGNMNDIQIGSLSPNVPDTGNSFKFDLGLTNISKTNSNIWVTDVRTLDDTATDISSYTTTSPAQISLNATNTFSTTAGSNVVTVQATGHGLKAGDVVYINNVGGIVDGIPASDFNGKAFKIDNVTGNSFSITVATQATTGTTVNDATATALPAYDTVLPGGQQRSGKNGDFTLDLSGNPTSAYYTVQVDVMVEDDDGNMTTSTVEYRIPNGQTSTFNNRYAARAVTGGGTLEVPTSSNPLLRAQLVDENGNPAANGEPGFLQIVGQQKLGFPNQNYTVAIDDLDSSENGLPNAAVAKAGTGWGFSHFYGLNNFFVSNEETSTGDTVKNSAINLAVRGDILNNPNLISLGTLTRTPNNNPAIPNNYSYERTSGDGTVAKKLADLASKAIQFDAAGGLPTTTKSFTSYASEILGYAASQAKAADTAAADQQTLLDGYKERAAAISGVNIDEEMANTLIFQHAYSASARVITAVDEMFEALINSV